MPLSNVITAFTVELTILERAQASPSGIRLRYATPNEASRMQHRIHHARRVDRDLNAKVYPDETHPLHNASQFDGLILRRDGSNLDIIHNTEPEIEELSNDAHRDAKPSPSSPRGGERDQDSDEPRLGQDDLGPILPTPPVGARR